MSTSLSTNLYGSSTNKGVSGLLSGLDTDDLVKQMTAGTRNKINRQYQAKQKLLYRQEAYREVSSKLLAFSDKYFSYSSGSKSNILSSSFFSSNTIKSSSDCVNVSGNAENIKNFSITDVASVATFANFSSDKIVSNQKFNSSELTQFTSSIAGETMSIDYNGKTYNLTIDKDFGKSSIAVTIQDVAKEINEQIAKISDLNGIVKYDESAGSSKLTLASGSTAKLAAASTKMLETLNMKVGEAAQSSQEIDVNSLSRTMKDVLLDGNITFDYNGVKKTISLSRMREKNDDGTYTDKYTYDADGLTEYLQAELNTAYGTNNVTVSNTNGKLTFETAGIVKTDILGISSINKELSCFIGIESGTYNRVNMYREIEKAGFATDLSFGNIGDSKTGFALSVNGKEFKFEKTAALNDIINTINNDADAGVNIFYSSTTDNFIVKADETGSNKTVDIQDITGNLAFALFGTKDTNYTINSGNDTKMTYSLNGIQATVIRSSLNFSIDGINIELNEKAKGLIKSSEPSTAVTFNVTNNSDEVVEKVKQFIDEYNEIITLINKKTGERPNRAYLPLTPEQSDDMKKEEIENWNAEAKKGILYGDSKMNNVLYSLREAMSSKTSVKGLVLADIGISSVGMDTSGKLNFDKEKFKAKLIQNPDEVADLFTKSTNEAEDVYGISIQINNILKKNVGSFGGSGILIDEAGMDNSLTSDKNYITQRINDYEKKMTDLKRDLEDERNRYYKKFTALEKTLSSLNSQSSWFTNMMGS